MIRTGRIGVTSEDGIAMLKSVFGQDSCDFYVDGDIVGFNDGHGTIWEQTMTAHWDEDRMAYVHYERHCGEDLACCWTDWEVVV